MSRRAQTETFSRASSTQFSTGGGIDSVMTRDASAPPSSLPSGRPVWRRTLYERQPFEDNYVDHETFLQELRENEHVKNYEYVDVMLDTLAISQEISVVVLFVFSFGMMYTKRMGTYTLPIIVTGIMIVTFIVYVEVLQGRSSSTPRGTPGDASPSSPSSSPHQSRMAKGRATDSLAGNATDRSPSAGSVAGASAVGAAGGAAGVGGVPAAAVRRHRHIAYSSDDDDETSSDGTATPREQQPLTAGAGGAADGNNTGVSGGGASGGGGAGARAASSGKGQRLKQSQQMMQAQEQLPPQQRSLRPALLRDFLRQIVSLGVMLLLLTPILSTLTVNYSDDTIVALSILTMCLHVLLADYRYLNAYSHSFTPNFSVNSAMVGVVLMASRIASPLESGSLVLFGNICFSLSPIVRHRIRCLSLTAHVGVAFLLFGFSLGCLVQIPVLAVLYLVIVSTVSLAIPFCFVALHSRAKNQINGPWDEARPTNSAAAREWANAI